ncbi:MAG: competence/damage-inducible protein A [Desulfomonile tiedjei]|uniref:CinA-like protein n=1 Tax=Desulfomonile tiedjei TaxID=2358 RepID=A0A9D6V0V5_9BACT|nr:competence/damage-inducible protein A [Desulfomonile tiedjei]
MSNQPNAWILTIGNEIINGVITDTNRETISRELRSVGITVKGMSSVGDDPALIADALEMAMNRSRIVIVSGGLGPTEDDKTAASVASFLGVNLRLDQEQLERIEARFRQWGRPMAPTNAKQALFPEGSIPIPNDHGTAPGFRIERNGSVAMFFPGVPRELVRMLRERGLPAIVERFGVSEQVFRTRTLHVYGLSESKLGEILADVAHDEDDYHLAFLPRFPIIRLRMDARGQTAEHADRIIENKQQVLTERISENIISDNGRSMEQVVLGLLESKGLTLALAESITGGMIGEMVTRVAGSSRVFMGSVVSYSNDMKSSILGVSESTILAYGAVSHQCAREMAEGARVAGNAGVGLSVTGIAGPDGGTPDKPVGTVFLGLATPDTTITRKHLLPGLRDWVRTLAAMQALDLLRRYLLELRIHGEEE